MRRHFLTWLIFGVLASGCENGDDREVTRRQLELAQVREALAIARAENNLVTKIESGDRYHTIYFEQSEAITVESRNIAQILYDSAQWVVTLAFSDGSTQSAHFIGTLDFDEQSVEIDPYFTCPLTAVAKFRTPVKGKFKVVVKGKPSGGIQIGKEFNVTSEAHVIPILGLYENYLNQVEFIFMSSSGQVRSTKTLHLPVPPIEEKPVVEIENLQNSLPSIYNGLYAISNLRAGFDQTGELRWFYKMDGGSFFGKLRNGNFVVANSDNLRFREVTMLGQLVREYDVPNKLHHEVIEMPNGNFLLGTYSPPGPPLEDRIVEISRSTGDVVNTWDLKTILDPFRKPLPSAIDGDWLHINAICFDEADRAIVISGRSQCAVVKLDYESGAIKWILSDHNEWKSAFTPFLLTPVDADGNQLDVTSMDFWSYGQHSIHLLPNGNLLLYDNGDYRGFYRNSRAPADSYTRIVEYKINEADMTVQLVWQFTNNKGLFTRFTGSTQFLGETRLAGYMSASEKTPRIIEVNTNHKIVYEATINRGKAFYYRALKVDLYQGID